MASKKIEFIIDVDGKAIDVAVDSTLNLKQQFRELNKELAKTKEGTPEFEVLSKKIGDVKDQMERTNAKSRDLFSSLSLLPGPVGAFAGQVDNAVGTLKTFTSFSFKDLKFQLGETLNDFKDIASNIGKATGITKIYTVLNNALAKSFVAVGVGETAAATGARAFAAALTATGVGALVVGLGFLISALVDLVSGEKAAKEASDKLNATLKEQKSIADLTAQAISRRNKERIADLKATGASEQQIRNEEIRQAKEALELAQKNENIARENYKKFYAKASNEDKTKLAEDLDAKKKLTLDAASELKITQSNNQAAILSDQKAANQKSIDANKQKNEKIAADNKSADEMLLDLQQENAALSIKNERDRQDQELKNQKEDEEKKINALQISQEKKTKLLEQVAKKYDAKQTDLNNKRGEEDAKQAKEWAGKLEEIRINAITNQQEKEKAQLRKGYDDTKADLDKALEDKKISQEQYNTAILNLKNALVAAEKKIDDDKNKDDQDKRLKKLDDELKFLQIKGEALMAGTKAYFDNQREILKKAEERELADTTLTEEQKTAIKEKYVAARKKLSEQEIAANAMVVTQTLDAIANLTGALASAYDEEAKTSKEAFEKRKKLQIATALISAASGIIQILTQPSTLPSPFDWITKSLNAIALGISTGVQISKIKKTQFEGAGGDTGGANSAANLGRNYAEGGMIDGPRHAQGGVMVEAEGGEAIMTRGAVTMFAPLLSAMNQMGGGTSFGNNLLIRADAPSVQQPQLEQQPMVMKTYVVSNELTSEAEKQARLKDLSTL